MNDYATLKRFFGFFQAQGLSLHILQYLYIPNINSISAEAFYSLNDALGMLVVAKTMGQFLMENRHVEFL